MVLTNQYRIISYTTLSLLIFTCIYSSENAQIQTTGSRLKLGLPNEEYWAEVDRKNPGYRQLVPLNKPLAQPNQAILTKNSSQDDKEKVINPSNNCTTIDFLIQFFQNYINYITNKLFLRLRYG